MQNPTYITLGAAFGTLVMATGPVGAEEQDHNTVDMDTVVVTATTTEHDVTTAPASVTVIPGFGLRARGYATIADALKETTGISLQSGSYGRQDIRIRGLESRYSLILIDGKRTSSDNALIRGNDFDLSGFPLNAVERIEVIRGPMSALYGSDAMGGVINIITRKSSGDPGWRGSLEAETTFMQEGEGGDQHRLSGFVTGSLIDDKLYASFAAETSKRDAWKPFEDGYAAVHGLEENDKTYIKADLDYHLNEQQKVSLNMSANKDERFADWARGPSLVSTEQEVERLSFNLGHTGNWTWGTTTTSLLREDTDLKDASGAYAPDTRTENGTANAEQTNTVADLLVNIQSESHLLALGGDVRETMLTSDRDLPDGDNVIEAAIFAQDEIFLGDLTLTAGLRVDNHEDYGTHFSPRLYAVYEVSDNIVVKGGAGTGFKAPDLVQTSEDYQLLSCRGACYLTGNPDLDPETNTAYETSVSWQPDQFSITAGVFYNKVEDKLYRDASVQTGTFNSLPTIQYINLDEAKYKGFELEAWAEILSNLEMAANYTYTDARDSSNDERLQYVPLQQGNFKLTWSPLEQTSTFVNLRYIGGQELSTGSAPSYHVVDLGGQVTFYQSISVKAGINNVNNVELHEESDIYAPGSTYSEPGRSVYLGLNYTF